MINQHLPNLTEDEQQVSQLSSKKFVRYCAKYFGVDDGVVERALRAIERDVPQTPQDRVLVFRLFVQFKQPLFRRMEDSIQPWELNGRDPDSHIVTIWEK